MKHVTKIEPGISVGADDPQKPVAAKASDQSWEEISQAIDERAHYIGPVLDHLLHMEHEIRPWHLRQ